MSISRSTLARILAATAASLLIIADFGIAPPRAVADKPTSQEKIAERDAIDQRLEELRYELDDVSAELADTYLALAETELLIPDAQQLLQDAQNELASAQEEDRLVGERLAAAQSEEQRLAEEVETGQATVDDSNSELAQVALQAYKGGGIPNPASVYVGSQDPQDSVDRMVNYRLTMASQGTRLDALRTDQSVTQNAADRLTAVREEIDALKTESEATVQRMAEAERGAQAAKDELDTLYTQQQAQRSQLETAKTAFEGERASLEASRASLNQQISALVEQERAAAAAGRGTPTSGDGWLRPVNVRITSNFGYRVHPIYRTRKLHSGVDFPGSCGTPVLAMESGRVIQTTYNSSAGNKLVLSHGKHGSKIVTSSYHHLQGFNARVGQTIEKGQVIGFIGTTGGSTGCHLHFEIHENGTPVNPVGYLGS